MSSEIAVSIINYYKDSVLIGLDMKAVMSTRMVVGRRSTAERFKKYFILTSWSLQINLNLIKKNV